WMKCMKQLDCALLLGGNMFNVLVNQMIDVITSLALTPQHVDTATSSTSTNSEAFTTSQHAPQSDTFKLHLEMSEQCMIPRLVAPPLQVFWNDNMKTHTPVVITGAMSHWPALSTRPWSNMSYLKRVAGMRTVPIEVGRQYTDADWSQQLITIQEFIETYITGTATEAQSEATGYLAQTQLFDQIPVLRSDIATPDYCAMSISDLGDDDDCDDDDESEPVMIVNAWFWSKGYHNTIAPRSTSQPFVPSRWIKVYPSLRR
ncbi:hypothetical protein SAMD00019534_122420, partial [Acytostelium subglobosum LB1]|uniref:hypothetical protein n=1 Tax=Acytostelium subglobosum LB1 TaxID=1410327 RepID=UPI000644C2B3